MDAPIDLNLVRVFRAVHEQGSFSAAGELLGVPRSTVSRAVAALEAALDLELFRRTTRKVSTTPEGLALFQRLAPALTALESALVDVPEREEQPGGTLRITATADFAAVVLADVVARYCALYPQVTVDLHLTQTMVDLARDGFDLGVRIFRGAPQGASMVVRKIGVVAFRLYASPAYLARRGNPQRIEDLTGHDWVSFRGEKALRLTPSQGKLTAAVHTRAVADDMFCARALLRSGIGIGALPSFVADGDVAAGALSRVVPRWVSPTGTLYLAMPSRKHLPARVRAFRDLLVESLRQRPLVADRA